MGRRIKEKAGHQAVIDGMKRVTSPIGGFYRPPHCINLASGRPWWQRESLHDCDGHSVDDNPVFLILLAIH
eukprot:scaffold68205_cov33-Cyclotella_meneghiniana.AAC.3